MLEILIGKYLDGEITPSEQCILQTELERDIKAKELLGQLQDLHERCCETVASEIITAGKEAEQIIERAWRQRSANPLHRILRIDGRLRFAAGLAAGLAIGFILHFVLPFISARQSPAVPTNMLAQKAGNQMDAEQIISPEPMTEPAGNSLRNVDWYSFTDKQGNQWLIEGLRENIVRPAVYYGDL